MDSFLIGYDLNKAGQDYETLIEKIEAFKTYWHCLGSTWIIKSNSSAEDIVKYLKQFVDSNDEILVVKLTGQAAWYGFSDECSDWLKQNL